MVAAPVAVESLLPVHVFRPAVQEESHHGLLQVAAVIEQGVKILREGARRDMISGVPSRFDESRFHLAFGAEEDEVEEIGIGVFGGGDAGGKLGDELVELIIFGGGGSRGMRGEDLGRE